MAACIRFTAPLLAAAFLIAACSDGDDAEPTSLPTRTPPPTATEPAAASTPTPIPPGITSPASTPGWLTYTSPFGFSFDYPEDWTFEETIFPCCPGGQIPGTSVDVRNPLHQAAREAALEARNGLPGEFYIPARSASFSFDVLPARSEVVYDPDTIVARCESDAQGGTAEVTETHGQRTVVCRGTELFQERSISFAFRSIELDNGRTLFVSPALTEPSPLEEEQAETILASLSFEKEASVATSSWPLYEDDTFSMRYPPGWRVEDDERTPGYVHFRNDTAESAQATREAKGLPHFLTAGEAEIAVGTSLFMRFGLEVLKGNCPEPAVDASFAGRPATKCGDQYWVERPSGGLINVARIAHETDAHTQRLLDAALATITFHE